VHLVYDVNTLDRYMTYAVDASPEHPVLVDKFLEDAFEFDVDAIADATGGRRHRRHHGAHRGSAFIPATSSCVVPPFICPERHLATIRDYTRRIAGALKVVGLMNVQYAIKDDFVYCARSESPRIAHRCRICRRPPASRSRKSPRR